MQAAIKLSQHGHMTAYCVLAFVEALRHSPITSIEADKLFARISHETFKDYETNEAITIANIQKQRLKEP